MAIIDHDQKRTESSINFPVVGIGASAGGIEAFKSFVRAIPEKSGMVYVFLQHLHPDYDSNLTAIIQRETKIPVLEITDNIEIHPDHIYVIPENKILVAIDGTLSLNSRPKKHELIHSIDTFFSSMAEVYQTYAIGVIFSGLGGDGTVGLRKIKEYGGFTFAQEASTAMYDSMPQHAINSGVVDFILPADGIAEQLVKLYKTYSAIPLEGISIEAKEEDNFKQILTLLRVRRGVDFTYYKQTTIRRRILRRMVINKAESTTAYLDLLRENKLEQDILYQDLLIPVTSFFRDTSTFDFLCEKVFPEMIADKSGTHPLRIWVAGCSTGEEAYSLAICLQEFLGEKANSMKIQIFATDISERAIDKARKAIYTKRDLELVSHIRLEQHFIKIDGHYQIKKNIRDMCIFAVHNFIKDPPFAKIDLVCCRNVLIYMEPYLQKKAMGTFHYALRSKGYLLLGKSETVGQSPELFLPFGKNEKIYTRKPVPSRHISFYTERSERNEKVPIDHSKDKRKQDFQRSADEVVLARFSPPGVVIDEQFEIVQFRGSTGDFLEAAPGKASLNLLKMAREGLSFEIRSAIHKVKLTGEPVVKENIPFRDGRQLATIEVIPLSNTVDLHYLVLFTHSSSAFQVSEELSEQKKDENRTSDQQRIRQLESELSRIREDMRSITEDQEAANEELQSANEELLSGSEELQSLNEELETSKEELQSSNEELMTINQELFDRSEQYNLARIYNETIVKTIHEPLLILNRDLRVKSANKSFYNIFSLEEEEAEGKIVFELSDNLWDIAEMRLPLQKLQSGKKNYLEWEVDIQVTKGDVRTFYLNAQNIESSLSEPVTMLAFNDITLTKKEIHSLKSVAEQTRRQLDLMQTFFMQAPAGFCIVEGPDFVFKFANPTYLKLYETNDITGKKFKDVFPSEEKQQELVLINKVFTDGKSYQGKEVEVMIQKGSSQEILYLDQNYQALKDETGNIIGVMAFSYNVTEKVKRRRLWEAQSKTIRNLLMKAPAWISTTRGPNHVFDLVNPHYQQLFGTRQLIGRPLLEAIPELKEQSIAKILDTVYETGETYVGSEIPLIAAFDPGTSAVEKFFNFSYQPLFDDQNKVFGILAFGYEVTDLVMAKQILQKNEAELKMVLETIPHMAYVTDTGGGIPYYNQKFFEYTGLTLEDTATGFNTLPLIVHPDMVESVYNGFQESFRTGNEFDQTYLVRNKNTENYRWFLSRASALRNEKGEITKWVGTLTDVNEQVTFVEELEKKVRERTESLAAANAELVRSNKSLEQFASIASHDLQEPLRKVQTFTSILMQKHNESLPPVVKELVGKIDISVKRMSALVKDVLSYSKITRHEFPMIPTDLNLIFKNVLLDFDLRIQEKNAVVESMELPMIEAVPLQMNQLFYNLISNALKFMPENRKALIQVKARKLDKDEVPENITGAEEENTYWEITFSDNGIGFDKQFSEQIFMIFQRLNDNTKYEGTGMGLALCQNIVFSHHGLIWADSVKDHGSVFHVVLPAKQPGN